MKKLNFPENRKFDIACLGRLAVDFYGESIGVGIENTHTFQKYLGGSSANMAANMARLGLKSAMISRVGDEQLGHFLLQTLNQAGCDTSQVQIDKNRLTACVFLALKDQERFPLLFYRHDCADMALEADDIDAEFFADCRALIVTGTHLSTAKVLGAARKALQAAKAHGAITALDIDYRPVLWGLTGTGDGETRYIESASVSEHLQAQLPLFDLIIGTEEEFLIAGGASDVLSALRKVRECTDAVLVLKRGALGCQVFDGALPDNLDDVPCFGTERVEVLNVLGAGDAFASGLMFGLLRGHDYESAARIANVCGAIVVSRHGCFPAMPTPAELDYWLQQPIGSRPDKDAYLQHLHRVTVPRPAWNELNVLAFDHRSQFEDLVREFGLGESAIRELKEMLFTAVEKLEQTQPAWRGKLGILADDRYAAQVLADATERNPAWWIGRPVEQPGSRPLAFDHSLSIADKIRSYPTEHTVKCLVFYHPEDTVEMRMAQEAKVLELWQAVQNSGHELLLEVIPPRVMPASAVETDEDAIILRSVARFYHLGVKPDWWKLPGMRAESWDKLAELVAREDAYCRGAVLLGLNQPIAELLEHFRAAKNPIVKGFMIGRSVWHQPLHDYLSGNIDKAVCEQQIIEQFSYLIEQWHECHKGA